MSERHTYRNFTAQQKTELVLAALKGHKTIAEMSRASATSPRRWGELSRGWE